MTLLPRAGRLLALDWGEISIGLAVPPFATEVARARLNPTHFNRATLLAEVFDPEGAVAAGYLDEVSQDASGSLADEQPVMLVAAILTLLGGLAAALLGRWGIGARLKEYR